MERVYINRECLAGYVVMAIHTIANSANKEISLKEFIDEIRIMSEIYPDEINLMNLMDKVLKEKNYKISIVK